MLGRTAVPLNRLLPTLLQASSEVWRQIVESASVVIHFGVGEGVTSPFPLEVDTAAFRVLQLRIAIEAGKKEQINFVLDRRYETLTPAHSLTRSPATCSSFCSCGICYRRRWTSRYSCSD